MPEEIRVHHRAQRLYERIGVQYHLPGIIAVRAVAREEPEEIAAAQETYFPT